MYVQIFAIFILLIIFITILFIIKNKRPSNYPPVPKISFPLIGHFPYFGGKYEKEGLHKLFMDWSKKFRSPIIGVDFGNQPSVVLNNYKIIREIFSLEESTGRLQGPGISLRGGDDGINRGLIFSEHERWTEQRRFSLRQLKEFGFGKTSMNDIIVAEAEEIVKNFEKSTGVPISTKGKFEPGVVNSLWNICAGERFNHDDPKLHTLVNSVTQNLQKTKIMGILIFYPWIRKIAPSLSGWTDYYTNFQVLNNFLKSFVEKRMSKHTLGSQNDFLDVYLNEMKNCTDPKSSFYREEGKKNLLNTLGDIFVAGSETTSTMMRFIMLRLALEPECQEKVQKEIDKIIGQNRMPSIHDRVLMPYTEAVILETLRLSSLVVFAVYHRSLTDIKIKNYFIPKDTLIIANIYAANYDESYWGINSNKFSPDRFLSPDKKQLVKHEAFVTFSTGRRVCIGENLARNEMFVLTSALLQKFNIGLDESSPVPSTQLVSGGTVCYPQDHKLIFTKRTQLSP